MGELAFELGAEEEKEFYQVQQRSWRCPKWQRQRWSQEAARKTKPSLYSESAEGIQIGRRKPRCSTTSSMWVIGDLTRK